MYSIMLSFSVLLRLRGLHLRPVFADMPVIDGVEGGFVAIVDGSLLSTEFCLQVR
jgi:hypothetical protein